MNLWLLAVAVFSLWLSLAVPYWIHLRTDRIWPEQLREATLQERLREHEKRARIYGSDTLPLTIDEYRKLLGMPAYARLGGLDHFEGMPLSVIADETLQHSYSNVRPSERPIDRPAPTDTSHQDFTPIRRINDSRRAVK